MIPIQHRFRHLLTWHPAGEPDEHEFWLLCELYISHSAHMALMARGYRAEWN